MIFGAPGEIRTPDLMVRSHALYPTELRALNLGILDCIISKLEQIMNLDGGKGGIRTHDGAINPILP